MHAFFSCRAARDHIPELGGAKAVLLAEPENRAATMAHYCQEITPLVEKGAFLTASDQGTHTQDFTLLPDYRSDSVMHQEVGAASS
ncbi:hypothetical protein ACQEVF_40160 [Nonomuraea polychroma]|uniref:hypothetical protein n=1 Tax=Nonomuraea polychroma TaxID=46176 RepID=UPI003D8CF67C